MVTLEQVRVEIGDEPRWCAAPGLREVLAPLTDGATSSYYLRWRKAILSSLQIAFGTTPVMNQPPAWTAVPADDPATPWSAAPDGNGWPAVTFAPHPPPEKRILAARYLVVAFSDADLLQYVNSNTFVDDDARTLKAIRYATIPVILNDPEKLATISIGQRREDVGAWISAQLRLRDQLARDIGTNPPTQRVAVGWASGGSQGYIR